VQGDETLLERALENVIRNAVSHAPDEGTVIVRVASTQQGVRITVLDEGPGVPEAELERIFEPFHRIDEARSPGGHGVGLALARAAIEQHGGAISAENRAVGGLAVRIDLPA
jgi:signal transduction histidine kinase